jgi:HEAT repeat protein
VAAIGAATDQERALLLGRLYSIDEPRLAAAVRALVHAGGDPEAIEQALWHLLANGKGRDDGAVRAAESLLADAATDARTRAVCAAYLLGTGDGKYTAVLVEALNKDANLLPRLQRFLDRAPRLGPELQDLLVARLQGAKSEYEVSWPCQILRKHDETKAVAALRPLLEHQNEGVRKAALEALAAIPGALQPDALKGMLAAADTGRVLIAADTLRRMDDPSGFERVLELSKNRGPKQADVIRVLGKFRMRAAIPSLLDALADADAAVRREAFTALGRLLVDLFPYRRIDVATSGYQPEASEDRRAQGLQVLRAWWAALKKT